MLDLTESKFVGLGPIGNHLATCLTFLYIYGLLVTMY